MKVVVTRARVARSAVTFGATLERLGVKPIEAARRAHMPATTIYSFLHGKTARFTEGNQEKLAVALGTTVEALFGDHASVVTVPVGGAFGALGEVSVGAQALYEIPVPPVLADTAGERYRAFEVGSLFMPPAEPGWIAIFNDDAVSTIDGLGRACLCELADGRLFFRRLKASKRGAPYFTLETWTGAPPIEDVKLVQALPFVAVVPNLDALRHRRGTRPR